MSARPRWISGGLALVGLAVVAVVAVAPGGHPAAPVVAPAAPEAPAASARVYGRVVRIQGPQAAVDCQVRGGQVLSKDGASVCLWIVTQDGAWRREVTERPKVRM